MPQDVTVIGFDDLDVAAWPCFGLTTVRIDLHAMARRAAELLVKRLGGDESAPVHECFPAELVLRHTHAAR